MINDGTIIVGGTSSTGILVIDGSDNARVTNNGSIVVLSDGSSGLGVLGSAHVVTTNRGSVRVFGNGDGFFSDVAGTLINSGLISPTVAAARSRRVILPAPLGTLNSPNGYLESS
jgi:hypothetical protein